MRLSHWGYHADFVVYPLLILACTTITLHHAPAGGLELWLASVALGWVVWTALEYFLHRWVLHRVPPFERLHAQHHAHPAALIGTPTWFSAPLFLALWAAAAWQAPLLVAGGLSVGLMSGYLAYAAVHDAEHHRRARPGSWLYRAKLRHARHHRAGACAEYGVSHGVWDALLHTSGRSPRPPVRRS